MGKVSVWIHIKNSYSCYSFTFFISFAFKMFQTSRYLEDLHFHFLVAFHAVFPELHLKVASFVHHCVSAFSGQSLSLFKRLRCLLHKEDVASLYSDRIFLMHARFFWAKSHLLCQHWTTNLALFFFLVFCHGRNVPGVCLSYQLTKKKHFSTSVFALHTEHWILCFLQMLLHLV